MATVIRQTEGHYEVEKVPYGKDFHWCPDCVVVRCDCGERLELTVTEVTCGCGADHARVVHAELDSRKRPGEDPRLEEEYNRWRETQDEYLRSEDDYRQELETLE
ncbi:MAG: hypothetical protein M3N10_09165 [Actinomycetota bacterium]|nr:hypothetical protein [Actinomycetota bacterium]HZY65475.1 hypothetical protein [Rubrobacteraceae bacterium]